MTTRIGLTGGIAAGKSTVTAMLRAAGVHVLDADQAARDVVAPGTKGLKAVLKRFGKEVQAKDGLDRKKLGALVFSDPAARKALEKILDPLIKARMHEQEDDLRQQGIDVVVWDSPLLFEKGQDAIMAFTIMIDVPENVQVARIMARNGLTAKEARLRIAAQMPAEEKRKRASYIIVNVGPLSSTAAALTKVWSSIVRDGKTFVAPSEPVSTQLPLPQEEAMYRHGRQAHAIKKYRVRTNASREVAAEIFAQICATGPHIPTRSGT